MSTRVQLQRKRLHCWVEPTAPARDHAEDSKRQRGRREGNESKTDHLEPQREAREAQVEIGAVWVKGGGGVLDRLGVRGCSVRCRFMVRRRGLSHIERLVFCSRKLDGRFGRVEYLDNY